MWAPNAGFSATLRVARKAELAVPFFGLLRAFTVASGALIKNASCY